MLKKSQKKWLSGIILISILIIAIIFLKYQHDLKTAQDPDSNEEISFQIGRGESVKSIAKNLKEERIIGNSGTFYWYTRFNDLGENIIAGRFILSPGMTIPEIVDTISDPSQAEFIITIQEGLRVRDIDQKLVDLGLIKSGEFISAAKNFNGWEYYDFLDKETLSKLEIPIEGYIYPDTYFLDPVDFKAQDLIYLAMDNFERKTSDLLAQIKRHSIHEIITMASIIENEVFGKEDREIVSGILWKRLENGWTLGADATLLYISKDRHIDAEDLEIDSPYNTRKNPGLPPGPISNPSLESIEAAMYPEESPYWFYLNRQDTGEVIYSTTNEEHNQNRAKYL